MRHHPGAACNTFRSSRNYLRLSCNPCNTINIETALLQSNCKQRYPRRWIGRTGGQRAIALKQLFMPEILPGYQDSPGPKIDTRQYGALFDNAIVGIVLASMFGEVVHASRFAEKQFGYGQPCYNYWFPILAPSLLL